MIMENSLATPIEVIKLELFPMNDLARINFVDTADKCGRSAIMQKNASKLQKNADNLWTCRNEKAST